MFKILIDTCVWLDLAKDYNQQPLLGVLEELIRTKEVSLILPRTVIDEFARNKARVIEDSSRSLSSTLKRVKEAVDKFGDPRRKRMVLRQLSDVDHKLPSLGEAAFETVGRIEMLFQGTAVVEISNDVKLRASQRAIDRKAPFHRQRNGIDDAILIDTYADFVGTRGTTGERFAFVVRADRFGARPRWPAPSILSDVVSGRDTRLPI
jgi:PIN domain-containing protein